MDAAIRKKMNYKGEQPIWLAVPAELEHLFSDLKALHSNEPERTLTWALSFVQKQAELERLVQDLAPRMEGDASFWFAYPKKSSKKYQSEITRDSGWQILGDHGYEPVRQIAIDEDWSALRFRKVEFIKTLNRRASMRLTKD